MEPGLPRITGTQKHLDTLKAIEMTHVIHICINKDFFFKYIPFPWFVLGVLQSISSVAMGICNISIKFSLRPLQLKVIQLRILWCLSCDSFYFQAWTSQNMCHLVMLVKNSVWLRFRWTNRLVDCSNLSAGWACSYILRLIWSKTGESGPHLSKQLLPN